MADIQFNVDAALAKLGALVQAHGPQAIELAARVTHASAVGQIATGALFLTTSATLAGAGFYSWGRGRRVAAAWETYEQATKPWDYPHAYAHVEKGSERPTRPADGDGEGFGVLAVGAWCIGAVLGLISLFFLVDTWAWVALFDPKLALAHQVLARLTQ